MTLLRSAWRRRLAGAAVLVVIACHSNVVRDGRGGLTVTEPSSRIVITNATVIDGSGDNPLHRATIVVDSGYVKYVGPAIPTGRRGSREIDASGKFVLPGLWDAHVHLSKAKADALPVFVSAGVTAVRDMGGDIEELRSFQRGIETGSLVGPLMIVAGPMLDSPAALARLRAKPGGYLALRGRVAVASPAEAARIVDSVRALGVDFLKIRESASRETYIAIANAARRRGIPLAGHAPFDMPPLEGAKLGLVTLEHASYPYPLDTVPATRAALLESYRRHGVIITPTFTAWRWYVMNPESLRAWVTEPHAATDSLLQLLSPSLLEDWRVDIAARQPLSHSSLRAWCVFLERTGQDLAAMYRGGTGLLSGTDVGVPGVVPGFALLDELSLMVHAIGLTPMEAIISATSAPARAFGLSDSMGSIAAGKRADLVLLDHDPLKDIDNLRSVSAVVLAGRYIDEQQLRRLRGGNGLRSQPTIQLLPNLESAGCARYWFE